MDRRLIRELIEEKSTDQLMYCFLELAHTANTWMDSYNQKTPPDEFKVSLETDERLVLDVLGVKL